MGIFAEPYKGNDEQRLCVMCNAMELVSISMRIGRSLQARYLGLGSGSIT